MAARWERETGEVARPSSAVDHRSVLTGAALMLGVVVFIALGVFVFSLDDTDAGVDSGGVRATTSSIPPTSDGATTSATTATTTPPPSTASSAPAPPVVGDVQTLAVALDDPLGLTPATASTELVLDPITGEICYTVAIEGMASPYDGHIHVGPPGVKGGIVVDLGALSGTTPSGCLPNAPIDTQAILGDLGGHYVEFHDPDGVRTIRAQLAMIDPAAAPRAEAAGAVIAIEAERIRLVGDVPDQVTIDKLVESFADIDLGATTLDTSELRIVPGSPRPSGRILVDDAVLFDVDSDQLADDDVSVLDTLATIFIARPRWQLTVVGHTDDTGPPVYNLELSLRRAGAVRAALEERGVPADSLQVEGAGSTDPIDDNDTPAGRARNRRIEFVIQTA
ncbi:MAG: OmpA family protein [Actinomycetota bacterium]